MTDEIKNTPTPALPHSEPAGEGVMAEPIDEELATPPETTSVPEPVPGPKPPKKSEVSPPTTTPPKQGEAGIELPKTSPTPSLPHSEPAGEGAMAEPIDEKPIIPPETVPESAPASPAPPPNPPTEITEEIKTPEPAEAAPILAQPAPASSSPAPSTPEENFDVRFKDKLRQLRGMANQKRLAKAKENEEKIMASALANNKIDNKTARELTGLSDDRARYYLNKLEKQGKLTQMGKTGPKIFYMPIK